MAVQQRFKMFVCREIKWARRLRSVSAVTLQTPEAWLGGEVGEVGEGG